MPHMPAATSDAICCWMLFNRCVAAADQTGGRGIITHAKDEAAAGFYLRWKFQRMPGDPLLLVIPMEMVRASLAAAS